MAVSLVSNTQYTPGATFTGGSYTTPGLPAATTGDIYFATVSWTALSGTGPNITFPAGWTQLQDSAATSRRGFAAGYIPYTAGMSNPTFTSTRTDAGIAEVIITVIRGADLSDPIVGKSSVLTASNSTSGSTIGGANAFAVSVSNSMVLWTAGWWNSNNSSTATWTGPTKSGQWISSVATSSGQYSYSSIATEFPAALATGNATVGIGAAMGEPAVQGFAFRPLGSIEPPITLVGTTTATSPDSVTTSLVCTLPSGIVAGDVLLAQYTISTDADSGTQTAVTTPTGWVLLDSSTAGAKTRAYTYGRYHNGTDTNVTFAHASVDCGDMAIVAAYHGADPSSAIAQQARYEQSASTAAVVIPSITTTGPNNIIHFFSSEYMNATITHTYSQGIKTADLCIDGGGIGTAEEVASSAGYGTMASAGSTSTTTITPSAAGSSGMRFGVAIVLQPLQNATVTSDDTGSAADTATVRAFAPGADTGTGTDAATGIRVAGAADTGVAADTGKVVATTPAADSSAAAADTAAVRAFTGVQDDTGTFTESAYVSTALQGADTGSGVDSASKITTQAADTGQGLDTAAVTAQVPAADTGSAADTAKITPQGVADTGTGVDTARVIVKGTDASNPTTETASVTVTVFGSDTATGTESQIIRVSGAADTGQGVDNAQRSISGILIAPRVARIPAEDRNFRVVAETRTIRVPAELRTVRVGYESDSRSISEYKLVQFS